MANLSSMRFEDVRLEDIDMGIRNIVITMNQFPFLETTESCQGHPFYSKEFGNGGYGIGYIMGCGKEPQFRSFSERLERFIEEHNRKGITQFSLPWNGRGEFGKDFFWLKLSPGRLEDLSTNLFTMEEYMNIRIPEELRNMERYMTDSWQKLQGFLQKYNSLKD